MNGEIKEFVQQKIDTTKLAHRNMPFKPPAREKPAFNSPHRDARGKPDNLKCCNFDLKQMFYEKGSGKTFDYKIDAKWDMPFDREQVMHEMIVKR